MAEKRRKQKSGVVKRGATWWISYTDSEGNRVRRPHGKDYSQAVEERNRLFNESKAIRRGEQPIVKQQPSMERLRSFLPLFLEYQQVRQTEASYRRTEGILELEEIQKLLDMPVSTIRKADIDAFATARAKKRSAGTVYKELGTVKKLFTWLVDIREVLQKSPASKYIPPCDKPKAREGFLSAEQVTQVLKECPDWLRPIVGIAIFTGMRRGEILGLTWSMVSFKTKYITLPETMTKNGDERKIPLNQKAIDILKARHKKNAKPDDQVFPPSESEDEASADNVSKAFMAVVRRLKIKDITFHSLRRTAGSHMRMKGVDVLTVAEVLGHRDLRTTKIYQKADDKFKQEAMSKLDAAF